MLQVTEPSLWHLTVQILKEEKSHHVKPFLIIILNVIIITEVNRKFTTPQNNLSGTSGVLCSEMKQVLQLGSGDDFTAA